MPEQMGFFLPSINKHLIWTEQKRVPWISPVFSGFQSTGIPADNSVIQHSMHHLQFYTAALYKVHLLHKMCHLLHLRLRILYHYSIPQVMYSFHILVAIAKYRELWHFCSVLDKNFICVTHFPIQINYSFPVMLESTPTYRLPSSLS